MINHLSGVQEGDRLAGFDFEAHNAEVKKCYAAYESGNAYRTPTILGTNTRYFMFNSDANPDGLNFERYSNDPDVMFDAQLRFQRWSKFNLLQDGELGLPEKWSIWPDFQNFYEAAWFGCPIVYVDGEVPDTRPVFADCPERVMENGIPEPFSGLMAKMLEYHERFIERAKSETYLGRPIDAAVPGMWTDGVMTIACNLFGADFVCSAMAAEPERLQVLLRFINQAEVERLVAWRTRFDIPVPSDQYGAADDSIALISTSMYKEHILPHHRMLFDRLSNNVRHIHLCGNAQRHFVTLRDELNVTLFDTGFPIDFAKFRRDLGPAVTLMGGPHVELLRSATPQAVRDEVVRILGTGILAGGKFILREANNLAPGTPLENTEAMYHACREYCRRPGIYNVVQ